ncbi:alpha/beta hydrolase family protein [Nocardioides bizhenqiangii]|uniref:Prolyl oligopeptidase family serine peptidase n=1 Tax=Nocardioides bizhenqiangii TaxID=3095076 RepID=A0ABZ0ZVG5_9ACTN|nr:MULTISPECIES: prolyl oligopeptidase family serine peptidase [unclassified Nocardioides]MDZ5622936.1 prolyl oligopeptidase family serine peptidase [Nocardioides sp. HM23]WQQ27919.1 prolyl oligopeptidase family serine peptidase [Nocardioides sp. HM61]
MKRLLAAAACCVFVLGGCTDPGSEPSDASPNPAPAPEASDEATTAAPSDAATEPTEQPTEPTEPPHPVSLPALSAKEYDGARLRLGTEVYSTSTQRQYEVTYRGSGLTLSGRIAIPEGDGPFPAIVLAHGYIDPAYYVNGQGMTREREWFANQGYIALHVDYRNHAGSDDTRIGEADLRMGYTEDVINAVLALRAWDGPVDDERMAVGGRSMGGGVVYNVLVAQPGLVDAGVVWAPVSSDAVDNYERWIAHDPGRQDIVGAIDRLYGLPRDNPEFWDGISARTYFDQITEPVLIHHGTLDDTCPLRWSRETARLMERDGVDVTLAEYPGEGHAFGPQFFASMERTGRYLRQHLR